MLTSGDGLGRRMEKIATLKKNVNMKHLVEVEDTVFPWRCSRLYLM